MISEAKKHRKNMDSDVPAKNCIIDDGKLKEMKNLEQITLKNHKKPTRNHDKQSPSPNNCISSDGNVSKKIGIASFTKLTIVQV